MNFKLTFDIARSLLLARWRQTLVASIGVTFGIAMFVALLSFMTGLNNMLDGLILNRTPHIRLFKEIRPSTRQPVNESILYRDYYNSISSLKSGNARLEIYNNGFIMQALRKDPRIMGFVPRITAQVFFNYGTIDINGVINGTDVRGETSLFTFSQYIVEGRAEDLQQIPNSIILGKGLAARMQVHIGDMVTVTTAAGTRYSLRTVGIYQSGINDFDKVQSYASMNTTQKILGKGNNYVTDIAIKVRDVRMAPAMAREYARIFDTDAEEVQTANAQFETGTKTRLTISYAVGVTLLIVAGFGIYNILNMMIYEKMDSIAILKATGFSGFDVRLIFLTISLSIGIFGGLMGLLFGFLLSEGIAQIPFTTAALPTIKKYPVSSTPILYFIAIFFSLITTYLAGFFPARKAGKIDPVIIIRGK
ncbi:MAG: ABC transporter permease [Chitinophagales bacterium]